MERSLQSPRWHIGALVAIWCVLLGAIAFLVVDDPTPDRNHPAILLSADGAVLWWWFGAAVMLNLEPKPWFQACPRRNLLRVSWSLGFLAFLAHLFAAFHLGHHWSHADAYRQTEATSGVGEGIFVNYLFGVVWLGDALWLAVWPDRYARRSRWVGWFVHGFLAFIAFNATVIYGSGVARWVGVAIFAILAWGLVRKASFARLPR